MLNKNKRAQLPGFITLFVITILISALLILFVVSVGIIKAFDNAYNGEKIYKDAEVGVGNIKDSMKDYSRFIEAESLIKRGESVEKALILKEYGKKPQVASFIYYGGPLVLVGACYVY